MVKVVKSEWHQVEKVYGLELDIDLLQEIYPDLTYYSRHITGLSYNFYGDPAALRISRGSAAHYSFSVFGETALNSNDTRAFVAVTGAGLSRNWNNTAAWASTNSQACLETIEAGTWYYIYLIVNTVSGEPDFIVTSQRSYSGAGSALDSASGGTGYDVVRRLGAFRTSDLSIDPVPFVTTVHGEELTLSYATHNVGPQLSSSIQTTAFVVTALANATPVQGLLNSSVATTANVALYSSITVRSIPPLPGITANINIVINTAQVNNRVAFFGEPWASSQATTYGLLSTGAPTQMAKTNVASVTSTYTRTLVVSPDQGTILDSEHAGSSVWGVDSGTNIRYAIAGTNTAGQAWANTATPTYLGWDVRSFTIAR